MRDPADPRGTARRALALSVAREEFEARRLEGARALALELAADPTDVEAQLLALRCESLAGQREEARRQESEWELRSPTDPAIELALLGAELALAREEPGAARRALGRALALGSTHALVALAWRDLEEGQAARCVALLGGCLCGEPPGPIEDRPRAWTCFALAQLPTDKADSIRDSRRALGRTEGETQP